MIQVITDSTADLPPDVAEREQILVIPCQVRFGNDAYREHVELSSEDFFERLAHDKAVLPSTSLPLPADIEAVYQQALQRGADGAFGLHLGSAFSGTFNVARLAAQEAPLPATVFDSGSVSLGLGWMAILLARAARRGANLEELHALAEQLRPRTAVYAMLDTLEYLRRGGRVNRVTELLAGFLDIKPILVVADNQVEIVARVRARRRALAWLRDKVAADAPLRGLAVIHAAAPEIAAEVSELVRPYAPESLIVTVTGAVIGTHSGPGAVGVAYVREE